MGKTHRFWNPGAKPATQSAPTREALQRAYTAECAEQGHIDFELDKLQEKRKETFRKRRDLAKQLDMLETKEMAERVKAAQKVQKETSVRATTEPLPTAPPRTDGEA